LNYQTILLREPASRKKEGDRTATLRQINVGWRDLSDRASITYPLVMAKKKSTNEIVTAERIEKAIHVVRGQRVMLDSDLAELYGVTTSRSR